MKRLQYIKHTTSLFSYLLIVWGFYRLLFAFPEPFDETIVKPLVWLIPVVILLRKEKLGLGSIGITDKKIFTAIYLSLALGFVFAIEAFFVNMAKYGGSSFGAQLATTSFSTALFISLITAITEELTFRGYMLTRLLVIFSNEWKASLIGSFAWSAIHLPVAIFDWRLPPESLLVYIFLTFIFGFGASFVFMRTRNVISSIILHFMWVWPIILFR